MRTHIPVGRFFSACRCIVFRRTLSRHHLAYLRQHYRYQPYTWGWRKTETMLASKVFREDGTVEAIVTTLLIDGRIWHDVERFSP